MVAAAIGSALALKFYDSIAILLLATAALNILATLHLLSAAPVIWRQRMDWLRALRGEYLLPAAAPLRLALGNGECSLRSPATAGAAGRGSNPCSLCCAGFLSRLESHHRAVGPGFNPILNGKPFLPVNTQDFLMKALRNTKMAFQGIIFCAVKHLKL